MPVCDNRAGERRSAQHSLLRGHDIPDGAGVVPAASSLPGRAGVSLRGVVSWLTRPFGAHNRGLHSLHFGEGRSKGPPFYRVRHQVRDPRFASIGRTRMIFRQILRSESGCASYLIGCVRSGQALVVDPLADLGARTYALEAADRGLRIAYVIDTHVHADHRSAGQELARATGATLALPENAATEYLFHPLRDGELIQIGAVRLQVLHTPGHTPESICLLGTDTVRSEQPWFLLSGDTLFPGDVGRPDLLLDDADTQERTREQAG